MGIRDAVLGSRDGALAPVKAYLDARGDPNFTDRTGVRLLHIDHQARSLEIVRRLLAAGADPNRGWRLPLAEAAKCGNAGVLKLLLDSGAKVNHADPKWQSTALIEAVNGAQRAMVDALVAAGADVNQADRRGQTPLIRTIENPGTVRDSAERRAFCLDLARFLVSKGANVNQVMEGGRSPLMSAVNENWPAMIRLLLDAGANAAHVDEQGRGLARRAMDGVLRLSLPDGPALELVKSMVDAGARDAKDAAAWARQRNRAALADLIDRLP